MKITRLLVLGAVLLLGSNAARAVDANVWPQPAAPTEFASMVDGETYYFYNVGSNMFFTQGNAWGTQASVGHKGLKVRIESDSEGAYHLTDYCESKSQWLWWWFVEDGVAMYVDYNGQADHLWEIKDMGGNVYRLSPSSLNPNVNNNNAYVGLNRTTDPATTVLTADNTENGGAFIDWKLVPEAYGESFFTEEYIAYGNLYDAAMQLKEQLDKAEAIGANVADQIAVYNNTNSSLEEINAAITAVKDAIQQREAEQVLEEYANATVEKPVDVTKLFIKNPSFVGNDLTGWSGDAFGAYNPQENAEHFNKNYNTYQELTELREGVYRFGVNAFYRAGDAQPAYDNFKAQNEQSRYAKVYAETATDVITNSIASPYTARLTDQMTTGTWSWGTDAETGESFAIPNNMVAADEFFKAGYCNDNSVVVVVSDGNLKVGVRKSTSTSNDWSIFDDFSLKYYGNGDDAYQLYLQDALSNLVEINVGDNLVTQSYVDAYNEARAAAANAKTKDEILSAIRAITSASDDISKNIELWKEIIALQDQALAYGSDPNYDPKYTELLAEWAEFDSRDLIRKATATNEELEAEIARVNNLIKEALTHPGEGADMTNLLVNPNFQEGKKGWTQEAASGGNVNTGGPADNLCYEAWNNAGFDIYQVVENAPMGVYEISVQGFYRRGRGTAYQMYLDGEQYTTKETCPVFIYMNANTTPFTNIFGDPVQITDESFYSSGSTDFSSELNNNDGVTYYFPNGMVSAGIAFSAGMYTQSAYGLVAQDGDIIRIGVKGVSNQDGDSWCIWDNFKLTYRGFRADVVRPVLEQAIIDGENSLSAPIGKDVVGELQAAIDEAKQVVNGDDGKAMFEALTKLFDMQEAVNDSKKLFATLEAANEKLANAIRSAVASSAVINEATNMNSDITAGLDNHTYSNSEVEELINEINKMINRLGIPTNMDTASDAAPVECTTVIVNPMYVDGNDEGWTGGAAINATATDAEKFNTNFDYYQLLQGLPAGTYKVSLTGFYRAGGYANDYSTYTEDPTQNNNAFLYATAGEDTVSVALHRLSSQAQVYEALSDGWVYVNEENFLAVPNSMTTAGDAFQSSDPNTNIPLYSGNNVIVKVGDEGRLTIGLKKNVLLTDDWTIWTNWQLFYYGKDSNLSESDNPLSIETAAIGNVVKAEFFTIDGARTSGLQKGITIVRETLGDGTTRVRKVTIK